MSYRKKAPEHIESEVLTKSGRRCCLCYGLNGDSSVKDGQIAHIDQDPQNSHIDNLVYLCIPHHDKYDSTTSQSKGITAHEVRSYRDALVSALPHFLNNIPRRAGNVILPEGTGMSGGHGGKGPGGKAIVTGGTGRDGASGGDVIVGPGSYSGGDGGADGGSGGDLIIKGGDAE